MEDPKPKRKKKRKRHAESILQGERQRCYLCQRNGDVWTRQLERHHVIFGRGRRTKAEEDGLTLYLCPEHHRRVHRDAELRNMLCAEAQEVYEMTHTREEWMRRYGKCYRD